jgi:hypothetical protein
MGYRAYTPARWEERRDGEDFARALGAWTGFYAALSAVAATLLGLLFVAVSLRLNLFQDAVVADVRDFAALVFGQFLALVLVGLVALFPDPKPATLGLPTLAIGALGLGWAVRLAGEYLYLNTAPGSRRGGAAAAPGRGSAALGGGGGHRHARRRLGRCLAAALPCQSRLSRAIPLPNARRR